MTARPREPLYIALADRMAQQIERGLYGPGQKLPSIRTLMRQEGLSLATIVSALKLLEDRGLLLARPRAGFLVAPAGLKRIPPRKEGAPEPRPVHVQAVISHLNRSKLADDGVNLGAAVIAAEWTPAKPILRALRKSISQQPMRVAADIIPAPGLDDLRLGIARIMTRRGVDCGPDDIIVTNGDAYAMEAALRVILAASPARPRVAAIECPTYFGILQLLERNGIQAVEIATDPETGLSLEALEPALQTGGVGVIIINPTFHNPFGCTLPSNRKRALVALAARYDIPIIEDDVFGDLHFSAHRPPPVKAFDDTGQVVYCSSFSKTLAPGWRIGWALPGRWRDAVIEDQLITSTGVGSVPQFALAELLRTRAYPDHIQQIRAIAAQQAPRLRDLILQHFPDGTCVSRPEGGFLYWIECPSLDASALVRTARQADIAIAPGTLFSAGQDFTHAIRISVGMNLSSRIEQAVAELGRLAHHHRIG